MKRIAMIGMPNTGKSTLFNRLTGSHAKVGNWPGLTVWSFSRWSVRVGDEVATILGPEPVAASVSIRGRMESAGVAQPIDIRARRVGDMLLVAVQYDDSGDKGTVFL